MDETNTGQNYNLLLIHPEPARAAELGAMIERSGFTWTFRDSVGAVACALECQECDVVLVLESLLTSGGGGALQNLRDDFSDDVIIVGLIESDSFSYDTSALFGAGVDLILHEPLVLADIERAMALVHAVRTESRRQARDRLRKMTALHELAVAFGHRTGSPGWLDRLLDAGRQILGPDALAMWSVDRLKDQIRCIGSTRLSEQYIKVAEQRSPSLLGGYEDLPNQLSTHWVTLGDSAGKSRLAAPEEAEAVGIKQLVWVPVRDSNRFYGHLSFYFMSDDFHARYDLVLADAFASIVAAALGTFWLQTEIRRSNRLYREHVESSPNGVVVCHADGTVERSNPAIEEITGRDRYEILGESIFDWFLVPDELPWSEWINLRSDQPADPVELWLLRTSGERRRVSCYARGVTFPDPRRLEETEHRIQVVISDITVSARRLTALELFHDLTRLISTRQSIEEAYDLVVSRLYDYLNYRLVAISKVVDRRWLKLQAHRTHIENVKFPNSMEITMGLVGRAVRENRSLLAHDVSEHPEYRSIDDDILSELVTIIRVDGRPIGVIDIQTDATQPLDEGDLQLAESIAAHLGLLIEQVSVQKRLERQALTDPLTGIANRRAFMKSLNSLVRNDDANPAALLLVELDHFKSINDRFGHLFGDEMLKQVAARLQTVLRDHDVLARYGGDEIAMIFYDVSSEEAFEIAERLRDEISCRPFSFNGAVTDITVSIGIALFPYHGRTTDDLIGEADRAMYTAKLQGRNSVRVNIPLVD